MHIAENGEVSCMDPPASNHTPTPQPNTNDNNANMEACFVSYCKTSSVRNFLVDACKKRKFDSCDSLHYHATYTQQAGSGHTYKFKGAIEYDNGAARKSGEKSGSRFNQAFQNGNDKQPDSTDYIKKVQKEDAYTWEHTAGQSLTASISTTVEADIPLVAKVSVTEGFSATINFQERTAHTATNTQTWQVNQHIVEEPHSCTRACIMEEEGTATVPFTLTGKFSGDLKRYVSAARDTDGYVCCYLRHGGASDCSILGHHGAGWSAFNSPGAAVSGGTCPGFGASGNDATYVSHGNFEASMNFDVQVKTKKGPYDNCPGVDTCDKMATNSPDLQFV